VAHRCSAASSLLSALPRALGARPFRPLALTGPPPYSPSLVRASLCCVLDFDSACAESGPPPLTASSQRSSSRSNTPAIEPCPTRPPAPPPRRRSLPSRSRACTATATTRRRSTSARPPLRRGERLFYFRSSAFPVRVTDALHPCLQAHHRGAAPAQGGHAAELRSGASSSPSPYFVLPRLELTFLGRADSPGSVHEPRCLRQHDRLLGRLLRHARLHPGLLCVLARPSLRLLDPD